MDRYMNETTHAHTHTRTYIHAVRRPLCQKCGRRGGSMGGSHFKLAKGEAGTIMADGLYLGSWPKHQEEKDRESKQQARINSVKAALAARDYCNQSVRILPIEKLNHTTAIYKSIRPRALMKPGAGGRPSWVSCEGEINGNCVSF